MFTQSRRIDALSEHAYSGADLEISVRELVPFVAAGLRALAAERGGLAATAPRAGPNKAERNRRTAPGPRKQR